jgi:hypothetical protein
MRIIRLLKIRFKGKCKLLKRISFNILLSKFKFIPSTISDIDPNGFDIYLKQANLEFFKMWCRERNNQYDGTKF